MLFEATPTFFRMILLPEKYSRTEQATDATHYTFLSLKAAHTSCPWEPLRDLRGSRVAYVVVTRRETAAQLPTLRAISKI